MQITTAFNISSMRLRRQLRTSSGDLARSMERLATGKRINRASDDPAAITVLSPMKGQIAEIKAHIKNIDEESYSLNAREGGLSVVADSLFELSGLVTTAANRGALSTEERGSLQAEAVSILQGIDYLANTATFRGQQILTGYTAANLGLDSLLGDSNLSTGDLEAADRAVNSAIENISGSRAAIGNAERSNDSRRNSLLSELENLTGAVSAIEDTDYAKEVAEMVRAKLMQDVATYLTTLTADTQRETVLKLLAPIKS